jgi:hypothetical protein
VARDDAGRSTSTSRSSSLETFNMFAPASRVADTARADAQVPLETELEMRDETDLAQFRLPSMANCIESVRCSGGIDPRANHARVQGLTVTIRIHR